MRGRLTHPMLYRWPAATPLTARAALPDVMRLVAREWWPLFAAVAGVAALGWWSWLGLLVPSALGALVAIEETAHLVAAARLAPAARLGLRVRRPLRLEAWVQGRLDAPERAVVALAGPLAAGVSGLLALTLPGVVLSALRGEDADTYPCRVLLWLPAVYLAVAALPLPGSDASVLYATRRRAPDRLRLGPLIARTALLLLGVCPRGVSCPGPVGGNDDARDSHCREGSGVEA